MRKVTITLVTGILATLLWTPKSLAHEVDSLNYAISSLFAGYILPDMPAEEQAKAQFIEGVGAALSSHEPREYFYGLINGLNVLSRLDNFTNMGLSPNAEDIIHQLQSMLSAGNTGTLNAEQANNIIKDKVYALYVTGDTVSVADEKAFIDSIASLPGSQQLPSGVVIQTLIPGDEFQRVDNGQTVLATYQGKLSDGTIFDETEQPIALTVGQLVPGFNEGLKLMNVGGTYRLVIPAQQGYGQQGIPGAIPGNAALDFTVTLISIEN